MKNCLYCYTSLKDEEIDYHSGCIRKFFGTMHLPDFNYSDDDILTLADRIVQRQRTVPGVQPKLSLELEQGHNGAFRLTIVGLWGDFILKPPNKAFSAMPEIESLTMHLAQDYGIEVVPFSLYRMQSGKLAYITKRIDRTNGEKRHMEDMCQLTERLTEDKYKGSYEQIAKIIRSHCEYPGNDILTFFEVVLFSFITGNADMHLKNFSLISPEPHIYRLALAYDLISSKLILPEDREQMALTLNGKKQRIGRKDFDAFAVSLGIPERAVKNVYKQFSKKAVSWYAWIDRSFLPAAMIFKYKALISGNLELLGLAA